jgi:hypothetical protein
MVEPERLKEKIHKAIIRTRDDCAELGLNFEDYIAELGTTAVFNAVVEHMDAYVQSPPRSVIEQFERRILKLERAVETERQVAGTRSEHVETIGSALHMAVQTLEKLWGYLLQSDRDGEAWIPAEIGEEVEKCLMACKNNLGK